MEGDRDLVGVSRRRVLRSQTALAIFSLSLVLAGYADAQQTANPVTAEDQLPVPGKWIAADPFQAV